LGKTSKPGSSDRFTICNLNHLAHSTDKAINTVLAATRYKPHPMAEAFVAQNPDRPRPSHSTQVRLKTTFFTGASK